MPAPFCRRVRSRKLGLSRRGYMLLDITPERLQTEWYYVDTVTAPSTAESFGAAWKVDDGAARVSRGDRSAPADGVPLAP